MTKDGLVTDRMPDSSPPGAQVPLMGSVPNSADPGSPTGSELLQTQSRGVKSGVEPTCVAVQAGNGFGSKSLLKMLAWVLPAGHAGGVFGLRIGWKLQNVGSVRMPVASMASATSVQCAALMVTAGPPNRSVSDIPMRSSQESSSESAWSGKSV